MNARAVLGMLMGRFQLRRMPWHIPILALVLAGIGSAFILSAKSADLAVRHLVFAGMGFAAFLVLSLVDYRLLRDWAVLLYGAGLLALAGLPLLGTERNNARRWYDLGLFLLQPSEPMKLLLVVALASYFQLRKDLNRFSDLLVPLMATLVPAALIATQPDLGTAVLLVPTFLVIAFLAGVPMRNLAVIVLAGCVLATALWFVPGAYKDYQKERVLSLVRPDLVKGSDAAEHARQVLQTIRAGGLTGEGWGRGVLNRREMLSERHTDFIFAVIAEEWGFFGTAGLILLYMGLVAAVGLATLLTRDPFGRLLAGGVTSLFAIQCLLNMAIAVRLAPITGMTLPLVSYGDRAL